MKIKINKRIVLSFLTIAGTLSAVVGITLALFTDTAVLSANALSTGDVQLRIGTLSSLGGSCSNYSDTSIPGITTSNLIPGGSGSKYFCLRNTSATVVTLDVTASASATGPGGDSQLDSSLVQLNVKCVDPGADTAPLDSLDGSISVALDGSNSSLIIGVPKASTVTASEVKCRITQTLSPSANDSAKGKTINYDMVFTGTQSAALTPTPTP